MLIKRSVKFILHKRKSEATTDIAIRMRVTIRGQRPIDFPIGLKVDLQYWDSKAERAIEGKTDATRRHANDINRIIEDYKAKINEVFARYELLEKREPTPEEVKVLFDDMIGRKSIMDDSGRPDFFSVFDLFVRQVGERNQWTRGTYQKFSNTKRHLKEFAPICSPMA